MFFIDKYKPNKLSDFDFNYDVASRLFYLYEQKNLPHIILSGPVNSGKKNIIKLFLELLFDIEVNEVHNNKYDIITSSNKKREIIISQSKYHIIFESDYTNQDKYVLQQVIKQYVNTKSIHDFINKLPFKIVLIHNTDKLTINAQAALRRSMEMYSNDIRFIMICNNLTRIIDPLKSRCHIFNTFSPSKMERQIIMNQIITLENLIITQDQYKKILKYQNIKYIIWNLNIIQIFNNQHDPINECYDEIINLILKTKTDDIVNFYDQIRQMVYSLLISNINKIDIVIEIINRALLLSNNLHYQRKIIKIASIVDFNMLKGKREIINIDYFILTIIKELNET